MTSSNTPSIDKKVHLGRAADDHVGSTNNRVWADTGASNFSLQTSAIHSLTSKYMQ